MFSASKTAGPSGYNINNSLRFRSSASAYLSRTPASASNRQTWTWSGWVKRGDLANSQVLFSAYNNSSTSDADFFSIKFNTSGTLGCDTYSVDYRVSSAVYRDPSAWYHVVVTLDTTQATANNRIKMYVNGSEITSFTTTNNPTQNANSGINSTIQHRLGSVNLTAAPKYFDGYMAEVNFIDGQALTPSSFGSTNATTGVWQPAKYTGSYGTNGFYLPFSDIATTSGSNAGLGKDFSGNSNYWTTNNISVTSGTTYDAMTDVPTLTSATVANYAVLNRIYTNTQGVGTLSNANLRFTFTNLSTETMVGTFGASTGKWYWEFIASANPVFVGIRQVNTTDRFSNSILWGGSSISATGDKWVNGTSSAYAGASWTTGDVIGVAVDMDGGTVTFYKNNTSQGSINLSLATITDFVPAFNNGASTAFAGDVNFGQRPFTYTPPTGFKALNTFNIPDSTIKKGNSYMDATLYTGNGSTQTITNAAGFRPDFVWVKGRNAAGYWNALEDSVRGAGKFLSSNSTNAETGNSGDLITSFNSNGFSVNMTLNGASNGTVNDSTVTYVGWQWQAGQGSTSSNTAGSITSTVSVNTTAGFSIVNYVGNNTSGATVGHGLGVAPSMIIVKNRDQATAGGDSQSWFVYHRSIGATGQVTLNTTGAVVTNAEYWNNTAPSATVFSLGNGNRTNFTGDDYIAYCWAEIAGFSKFGSYTGNGSTDGTFVYTGFRPKYVLIKRTDTANDWYAKDTSRDPVNAAGNTILVDLSDAEFGPANTLIDILSNGFKSRTTSAGVNASSGTYIYMAFAEVPTKFSLAR